MGFADDVGKSIARQQDQLNNKINDIATELFTLTVKNTPIGNRANMGQLINNWYLGVGKGQYNRMYHGISDVSASSSLEQVAALARVKEFVGKDGEVSLTNSTPYGYRAEYFGWNYSTKEPQWRGTQPYAMIAKSLTLVAAKYRKKG